MIRGLLLAACCMWSMGSHAQSTAPKPASTAPASSTTSDPKIEFKKYQLKNGLEVILHRDTETPLVVVDVWYHVGAVDETIGKSGFAHLFEHMLFQGSLNVGEDRHFEILKQIGGSQVNGSTSSDRTNYYEQVPSHELETALWLESDRMGYLLPLLNEKSLKNQIDVVRNERRSRYDNSPYGMTYLKINQLLYPKDHPLHYSVIGLHEELQNAKLADVRSYYQKWYTPANATLVVAGDFDMDTAEKKVAKWFGDLKGQPKPERRKLAMPKLKTVREQVEEPLVRQRLLTYAWHTPASMSSEDADLDILASVLGESGTGRLYKRLVLEEKLATQVGVSQRSQEHSSYFVIQTLLLGDADLAKTERIIDEELKKVRNEAISAQELKRAIMSWKSKFIWGLEPLMARAEKLQGYNHYWGNPDGLTRDLDRYRNSNAGAVQKVAASYLLDDRRIEVITVPSKKS